MPLNKYERIWFRGVQLNRWTAAAVEAWEEKLKAPLHISQGSFIKIRIQVIYLSLWDIMSLCKPLSLLSLSSSMFLIIFKINTYNEYKI